MNGEEFRTIEIHITNTTATDDMINYVKRKIEYIVRSNIDCDQLDFSVYK